MDIVMKHPKIDTAIRDTLIEKYGFGVNEAEGISVAIDMKDQDMSGYATKGDIKDVKTDIKEIKIGMIHLEEKMNLKIESSRNQIIIWVLGGTFALNQLPSFLNWIAKLFGKY